MDAFTPTFEERFKDTKIYQIPGRVKPYVRMTQRSKYVNPQAKKYLAWKDTFGWDAKAIMLKNEWYIIPRHTRVFLFIEYHLPVPIHEVVGDPSNFDTSNVLKGIEDALQGIVYWDDHQIDGSFIFRHFKAERYLVEMKVSIL